MYFGKSSCRTPPGGGGVGSDYKDISKITGNLKDISPIVQMVPNHSARTRNNLRSSAGRAPAGNSSSV